MNRKTILLLILILSALPVVAQDYSYTLSDDSLVNRHAGTKRVYYAERTETKPKIDGKLTDDCWRDDGVWQGDFIQQQPHQAHSPSQKTEFKILYDDTYLYVGIIAYDNEPEKIRSVLDRRDEYSGDMAGVAIDSYYDKQTAFEFNLTAAGQKIDLMHLGEYGWDYNWDAVWDGKTTIGDSAWYAEMRIPFSQLRYTNQEKQVWGLHVWRWIDRLKEEDQWKLIPIDAPAMVYIFGELRGVENISNKRNFELLPYAKTKFVSDARDKWNYGFGLDGKVGVTSDFTLDYTINPDFGQ
ncbi:MAG: sugar-binding protein, partial [Prolixibacteraceae bacterium]